MPLRDGLLDPIAGENPSGPDLYYDPVSDQIREGRKEDDDTLPSSVWDLPPKKADHRQIVKLAGEMLAERTKDLRLVTFLVESLCRLEGAAAVAPSIELLRQLQQNFWDTIHPEIEDGDVELRSIEVEKLTHRMIPILRELPLTASGLTPAKYRESRIVGYEADATTDDRRNTRKTAIEAKKMTAEEFDKAAAATPKAYFADAKAALDLALEQTEQLDRFQREAYGEMYPQLAPLTAALKEAAGVFNVLLAERRKIEPDPVATFAKVEQWQNEPAAFSLDDAGNAIPQPAAPTPRAGAVSLAALPEGTLSQAQDAYALIVNCAQYLFESNPRSPVPYLACAALRLGETRMQSATPEPGFAVGPGPEIRHSLRAFASQGNWTELLRATLPVMAQPCARAWLDLHRYIWRAAQETGAGAIASAVSGTLRELLRLRPEVRHWTLEDDTGAANPETQAWIDAEVLSS
jgi:type VI secretion system protein ImpA